MALGLLGGLAAAPLLAQDSTAGERRLPFTRAENADGARYVWFVLGRAGFSYPYIHARDFPTSDQFTEVPADSARAGDVAWWPTFVAVYGGSVDRTLLTPDGPLSCDLLAKQRGPPRFFRERVPG